MAFRKWTSIDKFSDAYKKANKFGVEDVTYKFKIKLHGTNAAIRIEDKNLVAQKRTSDISVDDDNAGFAAFVDSIDFKTDEADGIIFYGEWAGPGIQKNDAVSMTNEKLFYVFSVYDSVLDLFYVGPDFIESFVSLLNDDRIKVIPWYASADLNFLDQKSAQDFIDEVMEWVGQIGECDPYIKEEFGIEGPGEGLVGYPIGIDPQYFEEYIFKAKTEAHSVNQSKKRNHVAPEKPEGIEEFIEMFFTENRFNQILQDELGGEADRKKTGDFLKGVMSDVHKESKNEIEEADFEWKDVPKFAVNRVKLWFFERCDKL